MLFMFSVIIQWQPSRISPRRRSLRCASPTPSSFYAQVLDKYQNSAKSCIRNLYVMPCCRCRFGLVRFFGFRFPVTASNLKGKKTKETQKQKKTYQRTVENNGMGASNYAKVGRHWRVHEMRGLFKLLKSSIITLTHALGWAYINIKATSLKNV